MNFRPQRHSETEINITPLIDVVFLLLIFFMVSTTFERESEIRITLPEASEEQAEAKPEFILVRIDAGGQIYIDDDPLITNRVSAIDRALQEQAGGNRPAGYYPRRCGSQPPDGYQGDGCRTPVRAGQYHFCHAHPGRRYRRVTRRPDGMDSQPGTLPFRIEALWYGRHPLTPLLLPLSWLYRLALACRRFMYAAGFLRARRPAAPVIVVGNLTVGGTGKTPLIIWLARYLQFLAFKPGIISRGLCRRAAETGAAGRP